MKPSIAPGPFLLLILFGGACRAQPHSLGEASYEDPERQSIELVLNDFHLAASEADGIRYFDHMSADAVFLGTDAKERWTKEQFRIYAEDRFLKGQGWTYRPLERHVFFGPGQSTAWFDERLWNDRYGECRGTGALRRIDGIWKVSHYSLTFLVPNEDAAEVMEIIRRVK